MAKSKTYMRTYRARKRAQMVSQAGAGNPNQTNAPNPNPVIADTQPTAPGNAGSHTLAEIQAMDMSQYNAYMRSLKDVDMPNFLNQSSQLQKFVYDAGVTDVPQVVSQAQLNKLPGQKIYRTVNSNYDSTTDVGMRADQVARQTMDSTLPRVGDGMYGDGFYFAASKNESKLYGSTHRDVSRSAIMEAKLSSKAKVVNYSQLMSDYQNAGAQGDPAAYALKKGYNVIYVPGSRYYNVLDRSALVMSSKINPI